MNKESLSGDKKNHQIKKIVLLVLIVLVIILLSKCIGLEVFRQPKEDTDIKVGTFTVNNTDLREFLKEKQDASRFTTNIIPNAVYDVKTNKLSLKVANPDRNKISCVIRVMYNNEYYYTSSLMEPNSYIDCVELDKPLPLECDNLYVSYNELLPSGEYRVLTTVQVKCVIEE